MNKKSFTSVMVTKLCVMMRAVVNMAHATVVVPNITWGANGPWSEFSEI